MPAFAHPLWLLLPLAVPLAALIAWYQGARRGGKLDALVPGRLRARLLPPAGHAAGTARLAWRFVLLALLGAALARPQWGEESVTEMSTARDIVLAIDTSRSMLATDAPPNRLERAKLACLDLLKALPSDRFAVLGFAGSAFPLAPLTTDHDAIRETIMGIDTETLPVGGTDLAAAVQMSMEAFGESGPRRRALVLLSDGEDLEDRLDGVAAKAKEKGIFIFAFAIGTERGTMIPDPKAPGGFVRDERGQPVITRASETTLRRLATDAGGYATTLAGNASLASQLADGLARLDRFASEEKQRRQAAEKFQWPLGFALAAMLACLALRPGGAIRRRPPAPPATTTTMLACLAVFLAGSRPAAAATGNTGDPIDAAVAFHKEGKFPEAIQSGGQAVLDNDPARRAIASANLGNSLYEAGRANLPKAPEKPKPDAIRKTIPDWEDALTHLDYSLSLREDKNVRDNHARVAKALGELQKLLDEQEKQEQKEQQQKQDGQQQEKPEDNKDGQKKEQDGSGDKKDGKGQEQDKKEGKDGKDNKDGKQDGKEKDGGKEKQDERSKAARAVRKSRTAPTMGNPANEGMPRPKDGSLPDASSDQPGQAEESPRSVPMKIGRDGKIVLPENPAERARLLEDIRRNLEQRSMENRKVNLLPRPENTAPAKRDW